MGHTYPAKDLRQTQPGHLPHKAKSREKSGLYPFPRKKYLCYPKNV